MKAIEQYIVDRDKQVKENQRNKDLETGVYHFTEHLVRSNYTKNFTWMGVPILQYPSDLMAMQELIVSINPAIIIETGIAFGGMTLFYRDIQWLRRPEGAVIAVDIDIRSHAYQALNGWSGIRTIEGSSIAPETYEKVRHLISRSKNKSPILVSLDSNHTHEHVLQELNLYCRLVTPGSYIVVFDTAIETFGHLDKNKDRPWGNGNNPASAVRKFLRWNDNFVVDKEIEQRALITAAPGGWLRRVR